MNFVKPRTLSDQQMESRRRIRSKGRKHYIIYRGILGFGFGMLLWNLAWRWHDQYGHLPTGWFPLSAIIPGLIVWPAVGYFWGDYMWRTFYEGPLPEHKIASPEPDSFSANPQESWAYAPLWLRVLLLLTFVVLGILILVFIK